MYGRFVHLGVTKRLLNRLQSAAEQVGVQLLEPGASDASVEVDAFEQRIYLDVCLKAATNCNQLENAAKIKVNQTSHNFHKIFKYIKQIV